MRRAATSPGCAFPEAASRRGLRQIASPAPQRAAPRLRQRPHEPRNASFGVKVSGVAASEEAQQGPQHADGRRSPAHAYDPNAPIPDSVLQRNLELMDQMRGKMILAPLTKGGNLPFRRLCAEFGADVTMSEMAFAKHLIKRDRVETSRMYRAENEKCFGVQIATKTIDEGLKAAQLAADAGATFLDLNCGCPIHEVTRRGLGAVLPQKPAKLARLVKGIASNSPIPLTVKIRIGKDEKSVNVAQVVEALQDSGAAAVTIHGRTMRQRYKKAADWDLIKDIATGTTIPIIGNGDILTHYEAQRRLSGYDCSAVMVGRGALIKPWIFQEHKQGYEMQLDAKDRVAIYRQLVAYMKEHFGNDDWGKRKAWYFLPWHFSFLCRYRPFPEETFGAKSLEHPLIGTRQEIFDAERGETLEDLSHLERLLRCVDEGLHEEIAHRLWDSETDTEALAALQKLAEDDIDHYERLVSQRGHDDRDDRETSQG